MDTLKPYLRKVRAGVTGGPSLLSVLLIALVLSSNVAAQSGDDKNEVSIWGGYSPDSTTIVRFAGRVPSARFGMVALRYARKIHDGDSVKIRWTIDGIPAAFPSYPDVQLVGTPPTAKSV